MAEQVLAVHGYYTVEWDHAAVPERVWKSLSRTPNGCWNAHIPSAVPFRELFFQRLMGINPVEVWVLTPTCSNIACVNPAHTCVTMLSALSYKENATWAPQPTRRSRGRPFSVSSPHSEPSRPRPRRQRTVAEALRDGPTSSSSSSEPAS